MTTELDIVCSREVPRAELRCGVPHRMQVGSAAKAELAHYSGCLTRAQFVHLRDWFVAGGGPVVLVPGGSSLRFGPITFTRAETGFPARTAEELEADAREAIRHELHRSEMLDHALLCECATCLTWRED